MRIDDTHRRSFTSMPVWLINVQRAAMEDDNSEEDLVEMNNKRKAADQSSNSNCTQHASKKLHHNKAHMSEKKDTGSMAPDTGRNCQGPTVPLPTAHKEAREPKARGAKGGAGTQRRERGG